MWNPNMASAQTRVLSDQGCSGPECFNMWHDYMNLSKGLLRPQDLPETGHWDNQKRQAQPGPSRTRGDSTSSNSSSSHSTSSNSHSSSSHSSHSSSSHSSLSDNSQIGSPSKFCHFCKQNGETARVYRSHKLKARDGRVLCPILWNYTCPICEATGDQAHTRKYCPLLQRQNMQH